jgi:hypothetical protein
MKKLTCILLAIVLMGSLVGPVRAGTDQDEDLTRKLAAVFAECQTIQPGMTRAELLKLFHQDTGGVAAPPDTVFPFEPHLAFRYRKCDLIKVDVDFGPSDSKNARSTDVITKVSLPYLDGRPRV